MAAKHSSSFYAVVPGTPRLGPAPTPVGLVGHGGAAIPAGAPLAHSSSHPFVLRPPPPPGAYSISDTRIFRMNGRPFWVHGQLGKGGYGEVFRVEMLLPEGLEVAFNENGDIEIDDDDRCVVLRQKEQMVAEREPQETDRLLSADAMDIDWSVTFPGPPSWSTFGDVSLAAQDEVREEPRGHQDHDQTTSPVPTTRQRSDPHSPPGGHFIYSSGVFLALKIQSARSAEELALLVKEVENLRFLKGEQGVVQIIDHAVNDEFLRLGILMELGVCDLHGFLKSSSFANNYKLDLLANFRVWRALVGRVESLHERGLIHRDLKPGNFILVPKTYSDVSVLAQTPTPKAQFVYRLVDNQHNDKPSQSNAPSSSSQCCMIEDVGFGPTSTEPLLAGKKVCAESSSSNAPPCEPVGRGAADLEVLVQHPTSKRIVALPLNIKVSDFGTGQRLKNVEQDELPGQHASHVSATGLVGTVVYMPPEVVRQTPDRRKRLCKRADVWALGIMLFQMLHEGKTPFDMFLGFPGAREAMLAVASETVNNKVIPKQFAEGRKKLWEVERRRVLADPLRLLREYWASGTEGGIGGVVMGEVVRSLVEAWIRLELLFRLGECCLAFSVDDRVDCADLTKLMKRAAEAGWGVWGQGRDIDGPTGDDDGNRVAGTVHACLVGDARPRADVGLVPDSEFSQLATVLTGIMGRGGEDGTEDAGKEGMHMRTQNAGWEGHAEREGNAGREDEGCAGREGNTGREGTTDTERTNFSALDMEVARIGDRIGARLFPEVWASPKECARPERHALAVLGSFSGSCGCRILGIIGITISVLAAVGLILAFVKMSDRSPPSPGHFIESAPGPSGVVDITGGSDPLILYPSTSTGGPSSDDDGGAAGPIPSPNDLVVGPTSGTSGPETPHVSVLPFVEPTTSAAEPSMGQGDAGSVGGRPAAPLPPLSPPNRNLGFLEREVVEMNGNAGTRRTNGEAGEDVERRNGSARTGEGVDGENAKAFVGSFFEKYRCSFNLTKRDLESYGLIDRLLSERQSPSELEHLLETLVVRLSRPTGMRESVPWGEMHKLERKRNAEVIHVVLSYLTQPFNSRSLFDRHLRVHLHFLAIQLLERLAEPGNPHVVAALLALLRDDEAHDAGHIRVDDDIRVRGKAIDVLADVVTTRNDDFDDVIETVLVYDQHDHTDNRINIVKSLVKLCFKDEMKRDFGALTTPGGSSFQKVIKAILDRIGGLSFDDDRMKMNDHDDRMKMKLWHDVLTGIMGRLYPSGDKPYALVVEALDLLRDTNHRSRADAAQKLQRKFFGAGKPGTGNRVPRAGGGAGEPVELGESDPGGGGTRWDPGNPVGVTGFEPGGAGG